MLNVAVYAGAMVAVIVWSALLAIIVFPLSLLTAAARRLSGIAAQ